MRLTTWNVNGIRNPFGYLPWNANRTFSAMFDILEADIVVMQELKIQRKDLRDDMVLIDGWDCYFSLPKHKKGYSGVGIYTRNAACSPIRAEEGILGVLTPPNSATPYRDLPESDHIGGYPSDFQIAELGVDPALLDAEGRCVCLEFPAFVLFGVYSPANSNGLRDNFRYGFLCALDCRIRNLRRMGKRVVLVGDLNVSRNEMDTAGAAEELRKNGMAHEDYISTPNRRIFNQLIVGGEVIGERDEGRENPVLMDLVRDFHPDRKGMYTHWEQKVNARPGNFGSRIDFVLASADMDGWFSEANIQEGLMGSDHCPVFAIFRDVVPVQDNGGVHDVNLVDIMNPPGTFDQGARQREWSVKEVPAFSAKLMPEFYQRRSIKDMFKKPSTQSTPSSVQTPPPTASRPVRTEPAPTASSDPVAAMALDTPGAGEAQAQAAQVSKPSSTPSDAKRKMSDACLPKPAKRTKSVSATVNKAPAGKGQQSLKGFFQPKQPAQRNTTSAQHDPTPATDTSSARQSQAEDDGRTHNADGRSAVTGITSEACQADGAEEDSQTQRDIDWGTSESPVKATSSLPSSSTTTSKPPDTSPGAAFLATLHDAPSHHDTPANRADSDAPCASHDAADTHHDDDQGFVHDPIVSKESWQSLFRKPAAPLCDAHQEPCKSMLTRKKGENQGRSFWMCARPLGPSGQKEKATQWRCGTFVWSSDWKSESA